MLEELLKANKLGTKEDIVFLLDYAFKDSDVHKLHDIQNLCQTNNLPALHSLKGLLSLFKYLDVISISDSGIIGYYAL
jgi:hypothetical protein